MNDYLGADVEALRQLANKLGRSAGQIKASRDRLNGKMTKTNHWVGRDGDTARNEWRTQAYPKLTGVVELLEKRRSELLTNIREQDDASRADGGGPSDGPGGGPVTLPRPTAPVTPVVPVVPVVPGGPAKGPYSFSGAHLVDIADNYDGQRLPARWPDGSDWSAPGQCFMWVDKWLKEAGGPGLPGGTGPFAQFEKLGALRVDQPVPGDIMQRALPTGWGDHVHTAIVKAFNPATGQVTLVEGNYDLNGSVREWTYTMNDLAKPAHEVRFYRLGQP